MSEDVKEDFKFLMNNIIQETINYISHIIINRRVIGIGKEILETHENNIKDNIDSLANILFKEKP